MLQKRVKECYYYFLLFALVRFVSGIRSGGNIKFHFLFCGMGHSGFSYPGSVFMGFLPCLQSFLVAWTVSVNYVPEFIPIDRSKIVMAFVFIPFEQGIREGKSEQFYLFSADINKTLAKFIIGKPFDFPGHALGGMRGGVVVRTEHRH